MDNMICASPLGMVGSSSEEYCDENAMHPHSVPAASTDYSPNSPLVVSTSLSTMESSVFPHNIPPPLPDPQPVIPDCIEVPYYPPKPPLCYNQSSSPLHQALDARTSNFEDSINPSKDCSRQKDSQTEEPKRVKSMNITAVPKTKKSRCSSTHTSTTAKKQPSMRSPMILKKVSMEILCRNSAGKSFADESANNQFPQEIKGRHVVLKKGLSRERRRKSFIGNTIPDVRDHNNFPCKTKPLAKKSSDSTKENADSILKNSSSCLNMKDQFDDNEKIDRTIKACDSKTKTGRIFSMIKKTYTKISSDSIYENKNSNLRNGCSASNIEDRSDRVLPCDNREEIDETMKVSPCDNREEVDETMKVCTSKSKTGRLFSRRKSYNSNTTMNTIRTDYEGAPSKLNSNNMRPRSITNPKKENKIKIQLSRLKTMYRKRTWQSNKTAKYGSRISPDVQSSVDAKDTENEYLSNDELSTGVGIVVGVTRGNSLATKSTKNDCSSADYNYIESASLSHCGLTRVRANLPYSENSCA